MWVRVDVVLTLARREFCEMRKKSIVLLLLILVAAGFRLVESDGSSSLWTDEFATVWIVSAPTLGECFHRASLTQGQYPLFFLLEWCVAQVLPISEFSLRFFSLLASLISTGLVYLITSKLLERGELVKSKMSVNTPEIQSLDLESPCCCRGKDDPDTLKYTQNRSFSTFFLEEAPAIFAGLLFALNCNEIYYAQEARPYALATMCALLAQFEFLRLIRRNAKVADFAINAFFVALTCYTHYVFGVVLIFQNIWVALNYRKLGGVFIKRWCAAQIATALLCLPLVAHLLPILRESSKWTWLRTAGVADAVAIFAGLIDWKFVLLFALILCWSLICEGFIANNDDRGFRRIVLNSRIGFATLWVLLPLVAAYLATNLINSSLLDARYMLLALPGLFILMGCCAAAIRCPGRRVFFPIFVIGMYLMMVSLPCWRSEGRFSYRLSHDWRTALNVLSHQAQPGDIVLLRSGFIKENWVPNSRDKTILEYVQAPMSSFYFNSPSFTGIMKPAIFADASGVAGNEPTRRDESSNLDFQISQNGNRRMAVYNLTYSYDKAFASYMESLLARLAGARRIWILGVDPPNTNYPIERTPLLFKHRRKLFEKSFEGVYLSLLK